VFNSDTLNQHSLPSQTSSYFFEVVITQQTNSAAHKLKPRSFNKSAYLWVYLANSHPQCEPCLTCTSYKSLFRKVGLRLSISLTILSQESVILYSVNTTTFLTFSILNTIDMYWMFSVPAIVILDNLRMYGSILIYQSLERPL